MSKLMEFLDKYKEVSENSQLPEKWFILVNEDNIDVATRYLKANKSKYASYRDTWALGIGYLFKSEGIHNHSYATILPDSYQELNRDGFIEITNEQLFEHFK